MEGAGRRRLVRLGVSFQRPANPVLRDVTERVVIAGKGRFERALSPAQRQVQDLPSTATISREEFMEATTDLWEIAPERASRIGHPAPFPVGLPHRLVELYTYAGDVVLDPFMGSGSTAVASVRSGRHYIGFDTDAAYVRQAEQRVLDERRRLEDAGTPAAVAGDGTADVADGWVTAVGEGRRATELAGLLLERCGFTNVCADVRPRGLGITLAYVATDRHGQDWAFDIAGAFTTNDAGLRRGRHPVEVVGQGLGPPRECPRSPPRVDDDRLPRPGHGRPPRADGGARSRPTGPRRRGAARQR